MHVIAQNGPRMFASNRMSLLGMPMVSIESCFLVTRFISLPAQSIKTIDNVYRSIIASVISAPGREHGSTRKINRSTPTRQ